MFLFQDTKIRSYDIDFDNYQGEWVWEQFLDDVRDKDYKSFKLLLAVVLDYIQEEIGK